MRCEDLECDQMIPNDSKCAMCAYVLCSIREDNAMSFFGLCAACCTPEAKKMQENGTCCKLQYASHVLRLHDVCQRKGSLSWHRTCSGKTQHVFFGSLCSCTVLICCSPFSMTHWEWQMVSCCVTNALNSIYLILSTGSSMPLCWPAFTPHEWCPILGAGVVIVTALGRFQSILLSDDCKTIICI